jgi:NAD+ kinase
MAKIKTISLIGKPNLTEYQTQLQQIITQLEPDHDLLFDANFSKQFHHPTSTSEELTSADLILVFGGDGTLLKTMRKVKSEDALILSINLGNLGFLTEAKIEEFADVFQKINQGKYDLDKRKLLTLHIMRDGKRVLENQIVNEAVVHQGGKARLINLHIDVSGQSVCSLKADGLIISTATGSTGHSLSAGGPIIHPHINAILINPIAPISLSNRPIAVPSDRCVEVTIDRNREYAEKVGLTIDGQESYQLEYQDKIYIKESAHEINLIRMLDANYYQSLRDKLNWSK